MQQYAAPPAYCMPSRGRISQPAREFLYLQELPEELGEQHLCSGSLKGTQQFLIVIAP